MDGNPFGVPGILYRACLKSAAIPHLPVTASRALAGPLSRQNRHPVSQHEGFLSFVSSLIRRIRHNHHPMPEWVDGFRLAIGRLGRLTGNTHLGIITPVGVGEG